MIGPIDGRSGGWLHGLLDRLPRLGGLFEGRGPDPSTLQNVPDLPGLGESKATGASAVNVQMRVSQMLQSIGGGAQQDQALQMLITLMILLAMTQQQQQSSDAAASSLLDLLSRMRGGQQLSWAYTSINIEATYVQANQIQGPAATQPTASGMDVCG